MTRRAAGISLIVGAIFLHGCRYLADAIYSARYGQWLDPANEVSVAAFVACVAGAAYLIWAEVRPDK